MAKTLENDGIFDLKIPKYNRDASKIIDDYSFLTIPISFKLY